MIPQGVIQSQSSAQGWSRGTLAAAAYATGTHAVPARALPAYGETYVDDVFGSRITRVTGDVGVEAFPGGPVWSSRSRHQYSTTPAWSINEKWLMITISNALYSGGGNAPGILLMDARRGTNLYNPIMSVFPTTDPSYNASANEVRWSADNDDELICVMGNEIFRWNVLTSTQANRDTIMTIPGVSQLYIGAYQGNLSRDGRYLTVIDGNARAVSGYTAYHCDLQTGTIISQKQLVQPDVDYAVVSADGTRLLVNGAEVTGNWDRTRVYDTAWASQYFLGDLGNPSHWDTGYDMNGDQVICGTRKTVDHFGRIMTIRVSDGAYVRHTDAGDSQHQSMRNVKEDGWMFASIAPPASAYYGHLGSEIARVKLDGTNTTERMCHVRCSDFQNDARQPQACPAPSGDRCIIASDWGVPNGDIMAFVVEFPGA